jgi:hypothetical protein
MTKRKEEQYGTAKNAARSPNRNVNQTTVLWRVVVDGGKL